MIANWDNLETDRAGLGHLSGARSDLAEATLELSPSPRVGVIARLDNVTCEDGEESPY